MTLGFSVVVISRIWRVTSTASSTVPPTSATIAGAALIAKPPMPYVSVIALSPMSSPESSGLYPANIGPMTGWAGPVNQLLPPMPETRIPNSTPLRAMVVSTVLYSMPWAASSAHLARAIQVGPEK